MESFETKAYELFVRYPRLEEVFYTSDGVAFYQFGFAQSHAKELEDKTITKFTRDEFKDKLLVKEEDKKLNVGVNETKETRKKQKNS